MEKYCKVGVKLFIQSITSKSIRYLWFRSGYELTRRCGILARKFPTHPKWIQLPSLEEWRRGSARYLFDDRRSIRVQKSPSGQLKEAVRRIEAGEIQFFSFEWYNLGLDYDWVTNPRSGYQYDIQKHWTTINDFSKLAGDIKFVWEPSRFCWLYTLVRNDYHNEEDHSEFVLSRILDWIDKNPLNCGPNFKCSQEISLRVLNWIFALNFYKESVKLTDEIWEKIINSIYWQIHHVYSNINFSRIAVRNNHAITETLTLYLTGLLFPMFPSSRKWKEKGKQWFEREIKYQFEQDGTYIQNSMNYQRVVTQLLTLGIALAHKNKESFNQGVYDRAYANVNFLYQCQDEITGRLPNYGANDGALFFPLDNNDYCDYRPQLDALYFVLTGRSLYDRCYEDASWYGGSRHFDYPLIVKANGIVSFPNGGYYLIRDIDSEVFIRCGKFKNKCSPDLLHIDWWKDGEELLMDSGSFLYNTDENTLRYYSGTEGHNTIMLADNDQMKKGIRFVWSNPSDILSRRSFEQDEDFVLVFQIRSFKYLNDGYLLERTIRKKKNEPILHITDIINPSAFVPVRQIWHTTALDQLQFKSSGVREDTIGRYSRYYGEQKESSQVEFVTRDHNRITTIIALKR